MSNSLSSTPNKQKLINSTCLDLLLLEIVPLSIRITHKLQQENDSSSLTTSNLSDNKTNNKIRIETLESNYINNDLVNFKVENYGYSIGLRLGELLSFQINSNSLNLISKENNNLDILNIMKFICRDVWKKLYDKQMDNLRTNHRGTFVLIDSNFKDLTRMSSSKGINDTIIKCKPYVWFPCGIIRGILSSLDIDSTVNFEITKFPSVTFNVQTNISG
ncbi:Trs33p [Ascoidea rubescens DSM 1968]|uniref:Transport protein particle component n=1 Tax=Ascoidea rubescens DSM 1968 TaxID=1344418 RepID=A0A1D2VDZ8_9ASCO|nr:transport protein particle component [Ascoidea rubescens DSM 1968]ODV59812.1 transport protein particle component [Ascoidea rubescens DSM 1968]